MRLGPKLGEYLRLSNNVLISLITLEELKASDLLLLELFCVSYFQDHYGPSCSWFLAMRILHAQNQQSRWWLQTREFEKYPNRSTKILTMVVSCEK